MTKTFRSIFYRTKQADPLGEEEESLGEYYTDLEGGVSKDGDANDEWANYRCTRVSGGTLVVAVIAIFLVLSIGLYYLVLAFFYLPPEDAVIAFVNGMLLLTGGPWLVCRLAACFYGRLRRRRDLEDGSGGKDCDTGNEKPGSGGYTRPDDEMLYVIAYLVFFMGIYCILLGNIIVIVGGGFLAFGAMLVVTCCFDCRGSSPPPAIEG